MKLILTSAAAIAGLMGMANLCPAPQVLLEGIVGAVMYVYPCEPEAERKVSNLFKWR